MPRVLTQNGALWIIDASTSTERIAPFFLNRMTDSVLSYQALWGGAGIMLIVRFGRV